MRLGLRSREIQLIYRSLPWTLSDNSWSYSLVPVCLVELLAEESLEFLVFWNDANRGFDAFDITVSVEFEPAKPDVYVPLLTEKARAASAPVRVGQEVVKARHNRFLGQAGIVEELELCVEIVPETARDERRVSVR